MALVETKDLTYTYPGGSKQSIKNVSIKIEKGEFTLITGPSGCGKTTLCRCFNGLIPHFYQGEMKGTIHVAGMNIIEHPIYELARHVGLVFQNPENQLFALSVEKDVAFGLENLGVSREEMREKVDWALKLTGIEDIKDRAPHELSGGQQQRVAIARALANDPAIILADEPTGNLDLTTGEEIISLLKNLSHERNVTIISATHDIKMLNVSDEVVWIRDGRIERIENRDELSISVGQINTRK